MQLLGRLEIKSKEKIAEFLNQQQTGRISSIDKDGYPQIIPMNFVFTNNVVYMHSHIKGEKIDNITKNGKVGFEVDKSLEFLPSYFFDPMDASQADTLYISVVIKGKASLVEDKIEKSYALNALMQKYQSEGRYEVINGKMKVLDEVAVIKIEPITVRGKYKVGQQWDKKFRLEIAKKILDRNSPSANETIEVMGVRKSNEGLVANDDPVW